MTKQGKPGEVVLSYIHALDDGNFDAAKDLIDDEVKIIGPAGETFVKPQNFIDMMKSYHGKYDIKRVFEDGNEVCLLYDYLMPDATVYMSSWYKVDSGKIKFIRTIFDPKSF